VVPLLSEQGAISGISVCISGRERPFGVLVVHTKRRRTFTDDDVYFLQAIAYALSAAIERLLAEERQRHYAERLGILHAIDQAILAARTAEEIAHAALPYMHELVPCSRAGIAALDLTTGDRFYWSDQIDSPDEAGPSGSPLDVDALQQGETLIIADLRALPNPTPQQQRSIDSGLRSCMRVPISSSGDLIATMTLESAGVDVFTHEHAAIVHVVGDQMAIAMQNARLFEQVRHSRQRMQVLSGQLVRAQEDERRRLARELHDEIGQSLTAAQLNMQSLARLQNLADLPGRLEDSMSLVERVLQQVRAMSLDLRPSLLDDLGLAPALRWLVKRQSERAGFTARVATAGADGRFPAELETTCFRVAQEALNNITRHARATTVSVELAREDSELLLHIADDGIGFDVELARQRAVQGQSLGLLSMRERVELAGGVFDMASTGGVGTRIDIRLPLAPHNGDRPFERRKGSR
jgi:signal transduction histidine kinase